MFAVDVELHLLDTLGHILACLGYWAVRVLACHSCGHDEVLLDEVLLEDPLLNPGFLLDGNHRNRIFTLVALSSNHSGN